MTYSCLCLTFQIHQRFQKYVIPSEVKIVISNTKNGIAPGCVNLSTGISRMNGETAAKNLSMIFTSCLCNV